MDGVVSLCECGGVGECGGGWVSVCVCVCGGGWVGVCVCGVGECVGVCVQYK